VKISAPISVFRATVPLTAGLVMCSSLAFADPADAPLLDEPGVSIHLVAGQLAPFQGYLVSDDETKARGKELAKCRGTLAYENVNDVVMPKLAIAALISAGAAAVVTSIALGVALASKR